jgi:hypothetical protein
MLMFFAKINAHILITSVIMLVSVTVLLLCVEIFLHKRRNKKLLENANDMHASNNQDSL